MRVWRDESHRCQEAAAIRCFLSRGEEGVVSPKNEEETMVRQMTLWFAVAVWAVLAGAALVRVLVRPLFWDVHNKFPCVPIPTRRPIRQGFYSLLAASAPLAISSRSAAHFSK